MSPRVPAFVRISLFAFATLILAPLSATAQIYIRTDPNGRQVWSDHPIDQPTAVYAVPGTRQQFSTTPVADARQASDYDSLIAEHAARHALRPELVKAVIQVDSGFN